MKYALITAPTFIRNRLHKAGEVLAAYDGPFGTSVVPCNVDGVTLDKVKDSVKIGAYGVVHVGAGRWQVTDPQGVKCSEVFQRDADDPTKAKAQAQAMADQLNAGQTVAVEVKDEEETVSGNLPDA